MNVARCSVTRGAIVLLLTCGGEPLPLPLPRLGGECRCPVVPLRGPSAWLLVLVRQRQLVLRLMRLVVRW
ncbi:hypothetical protein [Fodinicola feengrottensis]|uniref:hypothetical protein n=1 Tax=Fodinicola feengrottensis TaxID=435914 RepID=UPI0024434545|nr:hypothetical protein [Fodinicola feengrottensis]